MSTDTLWFALSLVFVALAAGGLLYVIFAERSGKTDTTTRGNLVEVIST
jgi:hypothetical protein